MIQIGQEIIDGSYRYECTDLEPYVRQDGSQTQLAVVLGECAHCGEPFISRIPAEVAKPSLNRRCQKHKRPGSQVRKGSAHAQP